MFLRARPRRGDAARDRAGHLDGPDRGPVQRLRGCDAAAERPRDRPRRRRRLHRGAVRPGGERRLPRGGRLHAAGPTSRPARSAAAHRAAVQLRPPGQHLASEPPAAIFIAYGEAAPGTSRPASSSARWAATRRTRSAHGPRLQPSCDRGHRPAAGAARRPADERRRRATSCSAPRRSRACPARRPPCRRSSTPTTSRCRRSHRDSRYVGFVCARYKERDRLFVWDSQTQTLLNTGGIDLGGLAMAADRQPLALLPPDLHAHGHPPGHRHREPAGGRAASGLFVQRITDRQRRPRQARLQAPHGRPRPARELQEGQAARALELPRQRQAPAAAAATS